MTTPRKRKSQPRLPRGHRYPKHAALLKEVTEGLEKIARREGRSLSWVLAEIVADYFGFDAATGEVQ